MIDGDVATYLAQDAMHALRDHLTKSQTVFEAMSEQLPDVHFTIQQQDAVSMVAAMIREQRLNGILEGLRLVGLLNEVPNRRRAEGLGRFFNQFEAAAGTSTGPAREAAGPASHTSAAASAPQKSDRHSGLAPNTHEKRGHEKQTLKKK
ncbi:hypothetical protein [Bradyrhizobium sp. BWA-3-5]|uniref:hypothetical protein n=1 Tax=Bradyrhizobium sp. BWA-3-5 TaxID=3080013 RepID=UPI00293F0C9F|nr:hypothetical protein [Bradyrhizobium sp. BWA-3-5]WOH63620.1 hypothetical protein RX331_23190 [Bradyrhizobium sp. BWA-3-5]